MNRPPRGFTVIELVFVLVIGGILTSIALTSWHTAQGRFSVRGARNEFVSLQARARTEAIQAGRDTWLVTDVAGDSIYLVRSGTTLETVHFDDEFHVDLKSSTSVIRLCMTPRGYASPDCAGTISSIVKLQFWQNADSCSLQILPMGQLQW